MKHLLPTLRWALHDNISLIKTFNIFELRYMNIKTKMSQDELLENKTYLISYKASNNL